ncbi:retrovirus-related pol polyprotein from transposon TNT 1-94 [Tanacetum coccineum]
MIHGRSRIRLFIKGKKRGRMMLDSIDNAQQLQDDCDVQAINIILHGLPPDVYVLVNHQEAAKDIWDRGETLYEYYWRFSQLINDMHTIGMAIAASSNSGLVIPTFQQGEDPIDCINKAMAFLSTMALRGNYAAGQARVVKCYNCLEEGHMAKQCTQPKRPRSSAWFKEKLMLAEAQEAGQILDEEQLAFIADPGIAEVQVAQQTIPQNIAFQTEDLDAYDSDCDDISSDKAVLISNLSSCDLDVLSEVPYSDTYLNDMINQDVQEMLYSEQTRIGDFPDNEITSDSNIIPYS